MTLVFTALILAVVAVCSAKLFAYPLSAFDIDAKIPDADVRSSELPKQRSFRMGFVYQPFAWNEEAFTLTTRLIRENGDQITIFHDVGIPWQESLEGKPYPDSHEKQIARELEASRHLVIDSTSPAQVH